jgi:hypothetical protein
MQLGAPDKSYNDNRPKSVSDFKPENGKITYESFSAVLHKWLKTYDTAPDERIESGAELESLLKNYPNFKDISLYYYYGIGSPQLDKGFLIKTWIDARWLALGGKASSWDESPVKNSTIPAPRIDHLFEQGYSCLGDFCETYDPNK